MPKKGFLRNIVQCLLMLPYHELVKKAREMHKTMGEKKFRELYEKYPTTLAKDLGVHNVSKSTRNLAGNRVLQAFGFFPLSPELKETYESILQAHRAKQEHLLSPKMHDSQALHVLEARGLLKLKRGGAGRVTRIYKVLDSGAWKTVPKRKAL